MVEVNFCRRCGATVTERYAGAYICTNSHETYYKSYPAACIALQNEKGEVLIAIRAREPDIGAYDLPGGFCEVGETYRQAVLRELQEETGLPESKIHDVTLLNEAVETYRYEGEEQLTLCLVFTAHIKGSPKLTPADDVANLQWVPIDAVDIEKFSKGAVALRKAITILQQRAL